MVDRPLECSHCKRAIEVSYKEITDENIVCFEMCGQCPVLAHKLYQSTTVNDSSGVGICCGNCHTTLEEVKRGGVLGCSECYTVFEDAIVAELRNGEKSQGLKGIYSKKGGGLHMGKTPNKSEGIALSNKIASLSEALNDALKKENYEQAAWLRDQIKFLINKPEEKENGPS